MIGTSLVVQVDESSCQRRGKGIDLWSGKIPHIMEQLRPYGTTTEPMLQSLQVTTTEDLTCRACGPQQEKSQQ